MTKTLQVRLQEIKNAQKGIFIPYIMAGDHNQGLDGLFETIQFLEQSGVSAIEIGVPFSDPVADGPIIEAAGQRSLAKGVTLTEIVQKLKEETSQVPLIIMSYFNPVFQYGLERFFDDLEQTCVKGLIIPDLPYEQESILKAYLQERDICLIRLVSLTTGEDRQRQLVQDAQGFVYAVAINGVTGKSNQYTDDLDYHLHELTELSPVPVLTGFGVSSQEDILRFNRVSDGVIVGSKIVAGLFNGQQNDVQKLVTFGCGVDKTHSNYKFY